MNKKSIIKYILSVIGKKRRIPDKLKNKYLKFNFVDTGFIDSFEIFVLVSKIENKYKIKFSEKEISSQKFKTIDGLVKLILSKL